MLYGYYARPISYNRPFTPIDALINYTDAHYISWDFADFKFIQAIFKHYPQFDVMDGDLPVFLITELEDALEKQSQQAPLIDKLIKLVLQSRHGW